MSSSLKYSIDVDAPPPPTDEANLAALLAMEALPSGAPHGHSSAAGSSSVAAASGGLNTDLYEDDSDDDDSSKKTTIYILEQIMENLKSAGFTENAIKKAYASGCVNEKTAKQWITMQLGHPELDTPLDPSLYPQRIVIKKKVILTAEQRVAKIAELKEKIAKKKAEKKRQETDDAYAAEKARIAAGKMALEVREEQQARARAQAVMEQKRERDADAVAKEKIQLQLAIDKLIRKGKTPEEAEALAKVEMAESRKRHDDEMAARMAERRAARSAFVAGMGGGAGPSSAAATAADENDNANGSTSSKPWNLAAVLGEEQIAYSSSSGGAGGGAAAAGGKAATSLHAVNPNDIEASEPKDLSSLSPNEEGFKALVARMRGLCSPSSSSLQQQPNAPSSLLSEATVDATLTMLKTIVKNIIEAPFDNKKRYLKASNSHFKSKILSTPYALTFLKLVGFKVGWIEVEDKAAFGGKREEQTVVMNTIILRRLYAALAAL